MIKILATLENIDHGIFNFAGREITLMLGLMKPAQPTSRRFRSRMRSYRETRDQGELSWVLTYGVFILISVLGFAFVVLSTARRLG